MDTLAYSLNPEISDWFEGLTHLPIACHPLIGIPYAVWLYQTKITTKDGPISQNCEAGGFDHIYHNISWNSLILDIAGGMIGSFAVNLADKTSKSIWSILDERTIMLA